MARGRGRVRGKNSTRSVWRTDAASSLSDLLALFPIVGTHLGSQRARGPVGAEPEVFSWGTEEGGGRGVCWTN